MREILAQVGILFFLSTSLFAQQKELREDKPIAFIHVTVIDATGAPPKPDMTVIIAADRIVAMDTSRNLVPPADTHVIDAAGKFLIPGLWDMHMHLDDPEMWQARLTRAQKEMVFPLLLANGITGVRDMGKFGADAGVEAEDQTWPNSRASHRCGRTICRWAFGEMARFFQCIKRGRGPCCGTGASQARGRLHQSLFAITSVGLF